MIDALFSQPNYLAAKKLLDLTALRQEAIASNLSNVETPAFKRVDVAPNFETQLRQAIASSDVSQLGALQPQLAIDSSARSQRLDGNTVQLEDELLRLNQNSLEHALETQLVSGAMLRLRLAITGRS